MTTFNKFSIETPTQTLFSNLSTTTEIHGEKRLPAVDMKLTINAANDLLAKFHPSLMSSFYRHAMDGEGDLVDEASDRPTILRFLFMGPLKWDEEFEKYEMTLDLGLGGKNSNITLGECKVSKFTFDMKEGGTVSVSFNVRAHPDEKQAGKLYEKQSQDIFITLMPPDENQPVINGMF